MPRDPAKTPIFHITDIENLPGIWAEEALLSDAILAQQGHNPAVIGYAHIKKRRLTEIVVDCRGNRFVGEYVPFYFCPRSPMLYTINRGNTGRPAGCQKEIVHLVSSVADGIACGDSWAVSDGNAGSPAANFYSTLDAIEALDWRAIDATNWQGRTHQKMAEFLVADFFPWTSVRAIACYDAAAVQQVQELLLKFKPAHQPAVLVKQRWYY